MLLEFTLLHYTFQFCNFLVPFNVSATKHFPMSSSSSLSLVNLLSRVFQFQRTVIPLPTAYQRGLSIFNLVSCSNYVYNIDWNIIYTMYIFFGYLSAVYKYSCSSNVIHWNRIQFYAFKIPTYEI